jgi:glucose-1-phosphate thymidylyltransferase
MRGLLLAGGSGTRLRPLTSTRNKHMIPLANKPMLFYALQNFSRAGVRDVGIVLGPGGDGIRASIQDGSKFGLRVTYIQQGEPQGLAHAVLAAREFLGEESFVMHLGDNLFQDGIGPYVSAFNESKPSALVGVVRVNNPSYFGVAELDAKGEILSLEEKPRKPRSAWALTGVYVFTAVIHEIVAELGFSSRGEMEITDAISELRRVGGVVRAIKVAGWWIDAGQPAALLQANERLLAALGTRHLTHPVDGATPSSTSMHVEIGRGSRVASTVVLRPPLIIGADVEIEGHSVLGPYVSIGDHARILSAEIERSIVFEGVRITGPVRMSSSILGMNCHVKCTGRRATIDSALVGDDCVLHLSS